MQLWVLNKKTNEGGIYGGVTAFLRDQGIENTPYKSRLEECFTRKKLLKFEDETYRVEKKKTITAPMRRKTAENTK